MKKKFSDPHWTQFLVAASVAAVAGIGGMVAWQIRPEAHERAVVQAADQALASGHLDAAWAQLETLRKNDPAAADFYEGRMLARGVGQQSDDATAARAAGLLRRATGNPTFATRARLGLSQILEAKPKLAQSPTESFDLIRSLVEQGNKRASVLMARRMAARADADKLEVLRLLARASETNGQAAETLLSMIDSHALPVKSAHFVDDVRGRWFRSNLAGAQDGDIEAMVKVGDAYREGRGVAVSVTLARQWYDRAVVLNSNSARLRQIDLLQHDGTKASAAKAHQLALDAAKQGGSIGALTELGRDFKDGRGTPVDLVKAEQYLRKAAFLGSASAKYELADMLLQRQPETPATITEAVTLLTDAAGHGHAGAAAVLYAIYDKGQHGVPADRTRAFTYLLQAAKGGRTGAQSELAGRYDRGDEIVARDDAEAFRWAATAVNSGAQSANLRLILADAYARGDVVPQDRLRAKSYLEAAVAQGSVKGMRKLGALYFTLQQSDASQNAVKWLRDAAAHGELDAYVDLGRAYASGAGVPVDPGRAFAFFAQAADAGNPTAMVEMARSYATGYGVARDPVQAVALYQRAAQAGDTEAMIYLSYCYEQGEGVPQSLPQARAWLEKGAEVGDPEAEYWFAVYLLEGRGGAADHALALSWLQKSRDHKFKPATAMLHNLMPHQDDVPAAKGPAAAKPAAPQTPKPAPGVSHPAAPGETVAAGTGTPAPAASNIAKAES